VYARYHKLFTDQVIDQSIDELMQQNWQVQTRSLVQQSAPIPKSTPVYQGKEHWITCALDLGC
jgi:hypothetical protein